MSNERRSTSIDAYVGQRMKQRRDGMGLSQERLAGLLGISFQQVQKYERGLNRISASRLFQLCGVLGVEAGYFFDGLGPMLPPGMAEGAGPLPDPLSTAALLSVPGALDMLTEYSRLESPAQRRKVVEMVRILSAESQGEAGPGPA